MTNRFIQFELWHDCKNQCDFCHTKLFGNINKKKSIDYCINEIYKLNNNEIIGLIGGEFFNGELNDINVRQRFYDLISLIIKKINSKKISKLYIATSLIFDFSSYLETFCRFIQNNCVNPSNIMFCTSYDTIGRFKTNSNLNMWKMNINRIHVMLNSPIHVETIITGDFINQVMTKRLNINDMRQSLNINIDFISPHIFNRKTHYNISKQEFNRKLHNFFPKRIRFIEFVIENMINTSVFDKNTFLINGIRADEYHLILDGKHILIQNRIKTDGLFGGLNERLSIDILDGYIDSDIRMEYDVQQIFERSIL